MSDPFLGEIRAFGFNYNPRGWAFCQGQLLPIQQFSALFALLGTTYGGNGTTNFGLPDLRGRVAISMGSGPGLATYTLGEKNGTENVTLTVQNLPAHSHQAAFQIATPSRGAPAGPVAAGNYIDVANSEPLSPSPTLITMAPGSVTVANTGSGTPVSILQPFLALNYCIALQGIFPSRN